MRIGQDRLARAAAVVADSTGPKVTVRLSCPVPNRFDLLHPAAVGAIGIERGVAALRHRERPVLAVDAKLIAAGSLLTGFARIRW